ncbi:MAG: hypothetical protein KC591_07870 [Gemmatimonadetes bacterium]|nr:hypothetical protein [Gemmatimonadota bacterium]
MKQPRRIERSGGRRARAAGTSRALAPFLACLALLAALSGCAGGRPALDSAPVMPPPVAPAWRPAEAMAMLLKPPAEGANPIDDAYLERTRFFRARMAETDALEPSLKKIEKVDRGGRRTWIFDGPDVIVFRVDADDDGTVDQSQYFGPEGLYAITHRFAAGRRTQRIYWPLGESRIVEIRDNVPPYPGVWWRTDETPFARKS